MIYIKFLVHTSLLSFITASVRVNEDSPIDTKLNGAKRSLDECTWSQIGADIVGDNKRDEMGGSTAVNPTGKFIAMGMPASSFFYSSETNPNGTVRVYKTTKNNSFRQIGGDITGETEEDNFGVAVALTGNSMESLTLIVGAWDARDEEGEKSGHARVYTLVKESGTEYVWVQHGQDIDGETNDSTGGAVSVSKSGKRIAVGSYNHDAGRGRVQVFDYDEASKVWNQVGLDIDGEDECNGAGIGIALSPDGMSIAVGSPFQTNSYGVEAGQVRVFKYTDTQWVQFGQSIFGEAGSNGFGSSVSYSGKDIIAIGAPRNNGANNDLENAGHVRVMKYKDDDWYKLGQDIDNSFLNGQFGGPRSLSISRSGKRVAVGAKGASGENQRYKGVARVFDYKKSSDQWVQVGQDLHGDNAYDQFGSSVGLSLKGDTLSAGAPVGYDSKGYARIFKLQNC